MGVIQKVEKYIADNHLFSKEDKLLIGLSGGSDSVALLHILMSLGYQLTAAHCNFHLRGKESLRDETFVRELCKKWNIKLIISCFDTKNYAKNKSISIEMAARELRYDWFQHLNKEQNIPFTAIAHQMDDSVETVLLNMIRGTGIRGLEGIKPINGNIVRPILCLSKEEISAYLAENELNYVDDSTNFETVYKRNIVRHKILPLFEVLNPSAKLAIDRMSKHLLQIDTIYRKVIEQEINSVFQQNCIDIDKLQKFTEPELLLFEIISAFGFNSFQTSQIFESFGHISGKTFYSSSHRLTKDRNRLIIDVINKANTDQFTIEEDDTNIQQPINLIIDKFAIYRNFNIPKSALCLTVDLQKIKFPLILRKWANGDWFIPFGMKGKKKISDYFSDHKFSLPDKEATWLLCSGADIIWIVGHRSDDRFKISENSTEILTITWIQ